MLQELSLLLRHTLKRYKKLQMLHFNMCCAQLNAHPHKIGVKKVDKVQKVCSLVITECY